LKKDLTFLCLLSTDCKFFFANFLAFFPSFPIPFLSLPKNITKIYKRTRKNAKRKEPRKHFMPTSRINKHELLGFGGFQDLENSSEVPGHMKKERV
jgi:hypothetical protein